MRDIYLFRLSSGDQGTKGLFWAFRFKCYTIELPWRDNKPNISCIPVGKYKLKLTWSRHFNKYLYQVLDVPGRSGIRIHSGNFAGDVSLGYKSHSYGCILPGKYFGEIENQKAVLLSRVTLRKLMKMLHDETYNLIIEEA